MSGMGGMSGARRSDTRLRMMTPVDLPAVYRLEQILFPEAPWPVEVLRAELNDQPRTRYYMVATEGTGRRPEVGDNLEPAGEPDGEIVGYAGLAAAGGQGDVQTIGVRADRRGRGIGAALLSALLEEAHRRDCDTVFLEVRADNDPARRLYERFGFVKAGVRKRYYQPSGVDAIVMCLERGPGERGGGFGFGFGRPAGGEDA